VGEGPGVRVFAARERRKKNFPDVEEFDVLSIALTPFQQTSRISPRPRCGY
jgi:hypothetical protein